MFANISEWVTLFHLLYFLRPEMFFFYSILTHRNSSQRNFISSFTYLFSKINCCLCVFLITNYYLKWIGYASLCNGTKWLLSLSIQFSVFIDANWIFFSETISGIQWIISSIKIWRSRVARTSTVWLNW